MNEKEIAKLNEKIEIFKKRREVIAETIIAIKLIKNYLGSQRVMNSILVLSSSDRFYMNKIMKLKKRINEL